MTPDEIHAELLWNLADILAEQMQMWTAAVLWKEPLIVTKPLYDAWGLTLQTFVAATKEGTP